MLADPNDESPANVDAAKEGREAYPEFRKKGARCVRRSQARHQHRWLQARSRYLPILNLVYQVFSLAATDVDVWSQEEL